MNKSMLAGLCAAAALFVGGAASAATAPHAQLYRPQSLPALYVSATQAQAACPTDRVVWVNWEARTAHLPTDKYFGHTKVGAYACAAESSAAGIPTAD